MQGVEPSGHEPVHKHEDDRRRVKLVQGVTACDRVNARQNPIMQGVEPSGHEPVNSSSSPPDTSAALNALHFIKEAYCHQSFQML